MKQQFERQVNPNCLSFRAGPVEISEEVFRDYIREDGPNYSNPSVLFDGWIDETNPDELRRLMVRDIVYQTHTRCYPFEHNGRHAYYLTPANFGTILIDGAGGVENLRKLLRTRPKLLQELTEELLYALDYEVKYDPKSSRRGLYSCVIPILLSAITDEELGRQLWRYHVWSENVTREHHSFSTPIIAFSLTTDAKQAPAWLRDEILDCVAACFRYPASIEHPATILPGSNLLHDRLGYDRIADLFDRLPFKYENGKYTNHDVCTILRLAEDNLPANGTYLRQDFVIKMLPALDDELLALRVARRHVNAYAANYLKQPKALDELRTRAGRIFLYWLYGAASYHAPSDHDALQNISNLIALTSEPQV